MQLYPLLHRSHTNTCIDGCTRYIHAMHRLRLLEKTVFFDTQGRFEKVQELLDEISACQERWLALDDMFSVVQNTKKIAEVATFQTVDSQWKAVEKTHMTMCRRVVAYQRVTFGKLRFFLIFYFRYSHSIF